MAATSPAGRACGGRDAIPSAPLRVSAQRGALFRRVHLARRYAARTSEHPVRTVVGAWAVRGGARRGVGRCPEPYQEVDRGCRWAWAGKELVCGRAHQGPRPQSVQPWVAFRAAPDVLAVARQWQPDAWQRVALQEQQAGAQVLPSAQWGAGEQRQVLAPLVSLPRDLVPQWVPMAAQQARREQGQPPEPLEPLSGQREAPDGLRADVLQAHGPRVHVRPALQRRAPPVAPEQVPLDAALAAAGPL